MSFTCGCGFIVKSRGFLLVSGGTSGSVEILPCTWDFIMDPKVFVPLNGATRVLEVLSFASLFCFHLEFSLYSNVYSQFFYVP